MDLRALLAATCLVFFATSFPSKSFGAVDVPHDLGYVFQVGSDLWMGAGRDGVYVYHASTGQVQHLFEGEGLPTNRTTCGVFAFERIWLGTPVGLYYTRGDGVWERVDSSLIPSKGVNCISAGSKLYVGTKSGLAVYDPNSEAWTSFTEREGLPDDWILSVCPEGEVIWLGTMRGGLVRLDMARGEIRSWRVADGLLSNTVFSVSASDRYVFAGTTRGLSILDRETLQIVSYGQDDLPSPSVYSVLWVDETTSAWIGTGTGLAFWNAENGSITHLTRLGEIELGKVTSIVKVAGSIWITRPSTLWLRHRTSGQYRTTWFSVAGSGLHM